MLQNVLVTIPHRTRDGSFMVTSWLSFRRRMVSAWFIADYNSVLSNNEESVQGIIDSDEALRSNEELNRATLVCRVFPFACH